MAAKTVTGREWQSVFFIVLFLSSQCRCNEIRNSTREVITNPIVGEWELPFAAITRLQFEPQAT